MALRPIGGARRSAAIITEQQSFATLKDQARTAIVTLQAMRDDSNVTNAEAVVYIKDEALIMQRVIRVVVGSLA
jgi:hypothetical protein